MERDIKILKTLNDYRYLNTSQVHRLIFSDNKTPQSARRRLQALYHHSYIGRLAPYVQAGKTSADFVYYLDKVGEEACIENGYKVRKWPKRKNVKHLFLNHSIAISEFRINLDMAISKKNDMCLETFIPDYEMKSIQDRELGENRYKLFSKVFHPVQKKFYVVYPDALIIFSKKQPNGKTEKALYYLEIDRGTESLSVIRDKIIGYNIHLKNEIFKKYGNFQRFRVLVQTRKKKRAENIINVLQETEGHELALVTTASEVNEISILDGQIWKNTNGDIKRILRG